MRCLVSIFNSPYAKRVTFRLRQSPPAEESRGVISNPCSRVSFNFLYSSINFASASGFNFPRICFGRLKVNPFLRRLMNDGQIKFIRVSRHVKFPLEEIFKMVQNEEALAVAEVSKIVSPQNSSQRGS